MWIEKIYITNTIISLLLLIPLIVFSILTVCQVEPHNVFRIIAIVFCVLIIITFIIRLIITFIIHKDEDD